MRLPDAAHTSQPWRIHEIAADFRLEDVWELPGVLGPDDLPLVVDRFASGDPAKDYPLAVRVLFAIRSRLGELFGWDAEGSGVGSRVPTLRDRLPADLREGGGPEFAALPFDTLYLTADEWAAEIANRTMHGVLHIGRVPVAGGEFRARLAVLVKPNGFIGEAYMVAIRPFRHLIVYPALMRRFEREWHAGDTVRAADA